MIDVKQPLRTAYYQLLFNALTYNETTIPVSDELTKQADLNAKLYVLLGAMSGQDAGTFSSFNSKEQMTIQIVFKSSAQTSKIPLDNIAGQILGLLFPAPGFNGLPAQAGISILTAQKTVDRYIDPSINNGITIIRRVMTINHNVW